jgi:hypothetical protein
VASHGFEPRKVQVSSPHPNNRCGIPQNEVDRVAKRIRSLGGAPNLGIDLDYHIPAKVVLAGACEQSPWLLTPRPFRQGTIRMELGGTLNLVQGSNGARRKFSLTVVWLK